MTRRFWLASLLALPLLSRSRQRVIVVPDDTVRRWLLDEYGAELKRAGCRVVAER